LTDNGDSVLVIGADAQAVALALRLATTRPVRLHVPDPDDAARLRDGLARFSPAAASSLTLGTGALVKGMAACAFLDPSTLDPVAVEAPLSDTAPLVLLGADPAPVAARLRRPGRLFAVHPAGPIGPGALVELVASPGADPEAKARLTAMLRATG
jgi:hypothetical protein